MTPPALRARSGLVVVTLVVAMLALVLGLAGVVIAAIALGRSDQATTLATRAGDALPPAAATPDPASPTTDPETEAPEPDSTTAPGDISPTAEFEIKYQDEHLRVQSESCNDGYRAGVDLDEPRAFRSDGGDISYGGCLPGNIKTELPHSEISGQNATPADCLEKIRTTPAQESVAPSNGLSFCFQTSRDEAVAQGITQKLVILTINSITESNGHGIINITLKAWDVPE